MVRATGTRLLSVGCRSAPAGRAKATTSVPVAGCPSAATIVPSQSRGATGSLALAIGAATVVVATASRTVKIRLGCIEWPFLGESLDHRLERRNQAWMTRIP